jgi:hypothetical protein
MTPRHAPPSYQRERSSKASRSLGSSLPYPFRLSTRAATVPMTPRHAPPSYQRERSSKASRSLGSSLPYPFGLSTRASNLPMTPRHTPSVDQSEWASEASRSLGSSPPHPFSLLPSRRPGFAHRAAAQASDAFAASDVGYMADIKERPLAVAAGRRDHRSLGDRRRHRSRGGDDMSDDRRDAPESGFRGT